MPPTPAPEPSTVAARTQEILRKVQAVELRSRKLLDTHLLGAYHSVFKGTGVDFSEVREYIPGDDVRGIDWNVTARLQKPYVKVFEEDRELTLMLLVDLSASQDFGSGGVSKRSVAAELACTLAFSAVRNNDKVGLMLFTDQVEHALPPRKGRQHVLRVIRDILFTEPEATTTDLPTALEYLNRIQRRKAVCFLISDFLDPNGAGGLSPLWEQRLAITARRHDLVCVELFDPREAVLPDVGRILLEDAESGELRLVNTARRSVREAYARTQAERGEALQRQLQRRGVDHFRVSTDTPYIHALRAFLDRRAQRR